MRGREIYESVGPWLYWSAEFNSSYFSSPIISIDIKNGRLKFLGDFDLDLFSFSRFNHSILHTLFSTSNGKN
jgi:hypothetical protein